MGLLEKEEPGEVGKDKILYKMTPLKKAKRLDKLTFKNVKKTYSPFTDNTVKKQ